MAEKRKTELDLDDIEGHPPASADEQKKPKGKEKKKTTQPRSKKIIIIISISIICIIVIIAIGLFLIYTIRDKEPEPKEKEKIDVLAPPSIDIVPIKSISSFLLPISNKKGRERFLKMGIALELSDSDLEKEIDKNIAIIRDRVFQLTQKTPLSNFKSVGGRKRIRNELKNIINMAIQTGSIKKIYFTELVIL